MSDWDDVPTNAGTAKPRYEKLAPLELERDDLVFDLLPLVSDTVREDEAIEALRLFGIGYPQARGDK